MIIELKTKYTLNKMKKKLAIIGTKEFSEQIRFYAEKTGKFEFVGYFDDLEEKGTMIQGSPVLGKVEESIDLYHQGLFDCIFIGIGYTRFDLREYYYKKLKGEVPFANIIMPRVTLDEKIQLGEGIYIGEDTFICPNCMIDDNVFIHGGCVIAHDNKIGKHSYLAGRIDTAGFCEIGERNFVGVRVIFADHVKTCQDVWIGLACVVAKSINEPGKYMSPAAKLYKIE